MRNKGLDSTLCGRSCTLIRDSPICSSYRDEYIAVCVRPAQRRVLLRQLINIRYIEWRVTRSGEEGASYIYPHRLTLYMGNDA